MKIGRVFSEFHHECTMGEDVKDRVQVTWSGTSLALGQYKN